MSNNVLQGQEYIKSVNHNDDINPIVQEWGNKRIMSCSNTNFNDMKSRFYMFSDGSNALDVEEIDVGIINDFKVVGDYVFFCGSSPNGMGGQEAIMGYFNLTLFPSAPVTYLPVPSCTKFKKIVSEGYQPRSLKMFLTGVDVYGQDRVVEIIYNAYGVIPTWYVRTTTANYDYIFDDLVLTDNYCVVTARSKYPSSSANVSEDSTDNTRAPAFRLGFVLYFDRYAPFPSSSLATLHYNELPYKCKLDNEIMIDSCGGDWVIVATSKHSGFEAAPTVYVDAFNGINHYKTVFFDIHSHIYDLKDICFNKYSNTLEVLLFNEEDSSSHIYSLNQPMAYGPWPITANGHVFYGYRINSLCHLIHSYPDHFIASGTTKFNDPVAHVFGYHFNKWSWCSSLVYEDVTDWKYDYITKYETPEYTDVIHVENILETANYHRIFETKCEHRLFDNDR